MDHHPEYIMQLQSLVHEKEVLEEHGYILEPLSNSAIERKKKCQRCGKGVLSIIQTVCHSLT